VFSVLRKVAFLDRDGVINIDYGYVYRAEDFHFINGSLFAMRKLMNLGFDLIIVSNQSGIARGFYTEVDHSRLEIFIRTELFAQGISLLAYYYCPHHPEGVVERYSLECSCRKPNPGMILKANNDFNISMDSSIIVGDKLSDMEAGMLAGLKQGFLVIDRDLDKTGNGTTVCKDNQFNIVQVTNMLGVLDWV